MSAARRNRRSGSEKKVRVAFRRNRAKPARRKDWTTQARQAEEHEFDAVESESLVAKGDLSRQRTVSVPDESGDVADGLCRGIVTAVRGLFADVDDGRRVWSCTVRRVLRTRLITERHPITTGDRVHFRVESPGDETTQEGVIEHIEPRHGELRRRVRRRIQTFVANVDQAIVVSSAAGPPLKPHLIDRYIVAALAGNVQPAICVNKIDLDTEGTSAEVLDRYARLGYPTLLTCARTGEGIATLREVLKGKASVIVGQSGVGKSSLLNAVQPGLGLRTGEIIEQIGKGRHVTSTGLLIRLDLGGYVVDTPGIRSLDLSTVSRNEYEMYFTEFISHVENCKFPNCTHTHENGCAVKEAAAQGAIHPDRYASYVRLFEETGEPF